MANQNDNNSNREKSVHLRVPDFIEIFKCQRLLFDHEANDLLQLFDILRLMKVVPQHDRQNIVRRYPLLACGQCTTAIKQL